MPLEAKPLFRPDVLRTHLAAFPLPHRVEIVAPKLRHWAELLSSRRADSFKEQELLPDFLTDFFCGLLGYTRPADGQPRYTLSREKHVEVDGKFADAVLGDFNGEARYLVALEGKGPRDPLDRPFAGRRMSAVDQAYRYAINLPCDWIVVTSVRETRLYYKGADQHTYERFDTEQLADDAAHLKRFVFLLGAERVVPAAGRCHLYSLWDESQRVGRELTRDFYQRYADMRQSAFQELARDNPDAPRGDVLAATQKLLDRVLFCAFCEDRGLLPTETIRKAYEHRDPYHPRPIWDNFRGLFDSINGGNAALGIHAYNGGLFAPDPLLDRLRVSDAVCGSFRDLGAYDYRPASQAAQSAAGSSLIDVEILGHIFEQSISDLEKLRSQLSDGPLSVVSGPLEEEGKEDGLPSPSPHAMTAKTPQTARTRRKKEGAFYTPAFITRYIIEQALGGVLKDRFARLRRGHEESAAKKGPARTALADPNVYKLDDLKPAARAALVKFWESWQDELGSIRLLDPACGSGAFLIEAFDQLHAAYQASNDRLQELRGHRTLFDLDKRILENNLYGVDLNEEAIEICRLSLWIKTAERGKVLTSLDHTIRVGNSVVGDPAVHAKAFDWHREFPEVFAGGGFDVVVGNPPYIRQEWLAPYKPHWEKVFQTFDGTADIFAYFFEVGLNILRERGRLAFITSGSWVRAGFGEALRRFILANASVESMVDFGEYQPFEDAEMIRPSITVLQKAGSHAQLRLFKWLTSGHPPENLSEVILSSPTMTVNHLSAAPWELESDDARRLRQKLASAGQSLDEYCRGRILRGVLTGLTDVFVISEAKRAELLAADPRSADLIKPFAQGTHLRPYYIEVSGEYLLAIKSSANHNWPWSGAGDQAEAVFAKHYPAVHAHLDASRERAIKRQDQGHFWWELRACGYWDAFDQPKIMWPDISKLPRFSLDRSARCAGNTAYFVPGDDPYLLGVLSSWTTWFYISKTAQPLRLRGDRWQYRLFTQSMSAIPIPAASDADRHAIATLAERSGVLALKRCRLQSHVQRRLIESFGVSRDGQSLGTLNEKAQSWWEHSLAALGDALKTSFKLGSNPFKNPRAADEWEPYLTEHRAKIKSMTQQVANAETELNDHVYRLFDLTADEIKLLKREVEH